MNSLIFRPLFFRLHAPTFATVLLFLSSALSSIAATGNDIQFGGFASPGFLVNTGNNDYLGETSEGTFDFREYAANASYAKGSFRAGAQAFGQKLGVYGDDKIILDWATIDWQPTQWFGVRASRVKTPRGLYNEALDVDALSCSCRSASTTPVSGTSTPPSTVP
ncbi:MAG: hypothetical protein J6386_01355 [Candidatus Synoicihabitans palmerolidicus]|nr:hypothetical protein [Candidatus Synoicihabitans palmerolidicus]